MASSKGTGPLASISIETTLYLINLYRNHESLWDIKHPNYKCMNLKKVAWRSIRVNFVRATGIECTDEHIQKKLFALRSTFNRELRLLKDSKRSGDWTTIRKWPFFNAMQFLNRIITIAPPGGINEPESSQDSEAEIPQLPSATQERHLEAVKLEPNQDDGLCSEEGGNQELQPDQEEPQEHILMPRQDYRSRFCGKKRLLSLTPPAETSPQEYIEVKRGVTYSKQPVDGLVLWTRNLEETVRGLRERRRKHLRIQIDQLVTKALQEELDSDPE